MPSNELNCLEVLLRHVITGSSLDDEIKSENLSSEAFDYIRKNLFNYLVIESLLNNLHESPNFSLEAFLTNGVVLSERMTIAIPTYDPRFEGRYKAFYKELFKALAEDNFAFDDENNILVSSENLETLVPREWLHYLNKFYQKSTYQRLFTFNKGPARDITSLDSLKRYLSQTKTFVVRLESSDPNVDYDALFMTAKLVTEKALQGKKEVKVDEIIELFKASLPNNVKVEISKYKMSEATWMIPMIESDKDFYHRPITDQKETINSWIMSHLDSNKEALAATENFLLNPRDPKVLQSREQRNKVIVGLFSLYMTLLSKLNIDFDNSYFNYYSKVETYMDDEYQSNQIELKRLQKKINYERTKRSVIAETISAILKNLDAAEGEELARLDADYSQLLSELNLNELNIQSYSDEINRLTVLNAARKENMIGDIAFDNARLISLIVEAIRCGTVYINAYNKNKLTVELYNDELGKETFRLTIPLEKFLEFVENANFGLDDYSLIMR